MKTVDFEGFALPDDDPPILAFTVEMFDGRDHEGKFDVQFAAAGLPKQEPIFALLDRSGSIIGAMNYRDRVVELLDELIDRGELVSGINYDNVEWEEVDGSLAIPVMGRDLGSQFDVVQEKELPDDDVEALRKMRDELKSRTADD